MKEAELEINIEPTKIVRLFLEKLEILTPAERAEILTVIKLLNRPNFIS